MIGWGNASGRRSRPVWRVVWICLAPVAASGSCVPYTASRYGSSIGGDGPQQTHMVTIGGMTLPETVGEDPGKARAALVRFKAGFVGALRYLDSLGYPGL